MNLSALKLTKRRLERMDKMGIHSVEEVLKTYPYRYESIESTPFSSWQEGSSVAFEGLICKQAQVIRLSKNRSMTKFHVISWDEDIEVTLFNRPWAQQFGFGKTITVFGTYQGNGKVTASNYNFKSLSAQMGLHPVYSLTDGLKQSDMHAIVEKALDYVDAIQDVIPARYREKYRLMEYHTAIRLIHKPTSMQDVKMAIRTLKYEEFLCFQCVMQKTQSKNQNDGIKEAKVFDIEKIEEWKHTLPYELTIDQNKAIDDILKDMASNQMMYRLLQGDVGCGKTMVAIASLYACHLSNHQSALLAPTEILAIQHYENLKKQNLPVSLYISSLPNNKKKEILQELKDGTISIVVGTHALFQESVLFHNLGLVIVDEQQRFGVKQRRALLEKGKNADFLMMSATPIPRTYAHFLFGDMSISNIKSMPPGRKPVITKYIEGISMAPILPDILKGIQEGRQCYVVCPSIEEGQESNIRSATSIYNGMVKTFKGSVRIGLLHGKMNREEKEATMESFSRHEIDILISTTVVEVGIDVKNATLMVIYDAHRFGLSTLHQLRGRVARSNEQGYCYLLSSTKDAMAKERLKKLEVLTDGFELTAFDLELRGPGDVLGVRQSGLPGFILGDLKKDKAMMEACVMDAKEVLEKQEDAPLLDYVNKAIESAQYFD